MKKIFIFIAFFFIFVAQLSAQWTTNPWYGLYWGWQAPSSNDYSSELYRNGSFSIKEPAGHSTLGLTMQSKGYLFFDGQNRNGQWNNPNFGLSMGDFSKFNAAIEDNYNWNNLGVVLSGWAGLGLRTQHGAFIVHQNGIISMGLSQSLSGRDDATIRELSRKDYNTIAHDPQSGYTLYVRQGIVSEKIKVATVNNWPDYVFKKGYNLLTLSQVDTFIQAKGHLPNTPSAEVVESQGLELGATAKNHQEKLEEVFLHLIALEKRLKTLEAENAQLKTELHHLKQ